jgi:PAS domain S-box-containing protein
MNSDQQHENTADRAARAAQAETQTEQAKTRCAQDEPQAEQAGIRAEQSQTRADQNNTRLAQPATQTGQDQIRIVQAAMQLEQARTRSMEQALRASELSYRRLFEAAQDGILILDVATGRITDVNPFLVNLLGFSRAEMLGKTVGELSPFKDVVSNQAMLARLQLEGYVRYEDMPLKTKDHRDIDVEFVSNIYQVGDLKVIQCNIRDITRRKHAELTSNLLAAIVESSDDAIIGKDLNGSITSWNKGAEKIFGYTAGEMLGTSILRLIPADRQEEEKRILEKIRQGESVLHFETRRQTKDGRQIDVSVTASPIKGADGRAIGVSKVARDITGRKQAEHLLRESEEKFRQIAENINEVFWITDPTMRRMIYVSPAYEKIWGRTCQSLYAAPHTWLDAVHPEDRERVIRRAATRLATGEYNEVYRITRPDGSLRWIHDRAVPLRNAAGEIHRLIGTAGDVTENRKLEDAFRQAQKMESIGQLAGGIAHDFNNILSAIVANLELAKMDAAGHPALLEPLENISHASRRAAELVRQILTFSRQNRPEREPLKLNHVVLEALKLLRSSVPATIRIQTELTETPAVLANRTAIHQLIMNLGTNAWQAMRDQTGVLKVEMNALEVDENFVKTHPDLGPGRYVQLSVSDTGCGMDRATQEHIFEPFFTTKGVGQGTGLGLAVVHGIMKSHDGGVSVYSQPGQGTKFHLYFPVIETEIAEEKLEAAPIPRGNGEHILFVDDEDALAGAAKKMLERLGYTVTTTTSPTEALAAVRAQPEAFDLVITDLTMPGMDGARLGGQLLQLQPNLPIILTTGYSGLMTAEKVRELGFRELLSKPCTLRTLGETVHRALPPAASSKT